MTCLSQATIHGGRKQAVWLLSKTKQECIVRNDQMCLKEKRETKNPNNINFHLYGTYIYIERGGESINAIG